MATYTRTYDNNTGGTGIKSAHCITLTDKTDSINNICPNIPDYSIINNVTIAFEWKTSLGSSKGDCNIDIDRDNSDYFSTVSLGKQIGALSQVDNDYTWVTRDKSSSIENTSARLPDYFNSGKSNVGQYSGSYTLCIWFSATVVRKFYWRNLTMKFDYTPPTYVISLTAGTGGTVSGAGTYNVGSTATIKATPNTGYRFVKWSDGNTSAERQITVTTSDISSNVTNRSYTATFELISYTITATAGTGGTVSGGGSYGYGKTATLTATPNTGYKFVKWSDGNTSNPRTVTVSGNATYTAIFEKTECTVIFKNQDGSVVKTSKIQSGSKLGTLPTVSRSGYTFAGWIPCAPAIKTDGSVLDSYQYNGSNTFYALDKKYKYTDKLSIHIEAYMSDWADIKNLKSQIASCTEGGGWGLGFQANTTGNGSEIYSGGSYRGIDLGFNTPSNFTNKTWYSFDIVFSNGTFEVYLNGTKKGTQTTAASTISYNSDNTIFVGAEAGKNATTPAGNYFKGFISNVFIANQGTRLQVATTSTVVESDVEYYPIWRKNTTHTATFKNHDGTVLQTVSVESGSTPSYTGSTPTKASTAEYTYTFSSWSPSISAITADTTYTAQFTATKRKYTISASGSNGSVSGGGTYEYGSSITLVATPNTGYKFVKWSDGNTSSSRTVTVTGAATYTAVFEKLLPVFTSVEMIYSDKQVSSTNKVTAGQSFIISASVINT